MYLFKLVKLSFGRQPVLCISLLFALATVLVVPPDAKYLDYVDWRVIGMLFCLMLVVMGFRRIGVMDSLSGTIIKTFCNMRSLTLGLVVMAFFTSMFLTNDVALISLVPLSMAVLSRAGRLDDAVRIVTLEAIAANLGSMATPLGNPQNLYLYTYFHIPTIDFFAAMTPLSLLSLVLLIVLALMTKKEAIVPHTTQKAEPEVEPTKFRYVVLSCLFIAAILAVFRLIPVHWIIAAMIPAFLIIDRRALLKIDYGLLGTFIVFFVFVGNLQRIEFVNNTLTQLASEHALSGGFILSQFISNVPSAILLSGFTQDSTGLLAGVNIGGLGTLVASLASLIAFQGFAKVCQNEKMKFLGVFTVYNFGFAAILLLFQNFVL